MLISPMLAVSTYKTNNTPNRPISTPRYGNLAPLACDTISFTSGKKELNEEDRNDGINLSTAKIIYKDAEFAQRYLNRQLDKILSGIVRPQHGIGSQSKPILEIATRTKLPESIKEKSETRRLRSIEEVKEGMTDIVGARIVMADSSRQAVDSVIEKLTEAVQNNRLKIIEIENYRPEPEMNNNGEITRTYDYASPLALKNLKEACDDKMSQSIKKVDEDRPSGYMAIHLLVQLPNNFVGEIQIIGPEVERLKEVEDKCFKVKDGKHLPKMYDSVEKILKPLANKKDEILRKEHNIYTRKAYILQRVYEQETPDVKNRKSQDFLHIPEYLPESFDFNKIAIEIAKCEAKNKKKES